jgi:hypothetical protein
MEWADAPGIIVTPADLSLPWSRALTDFLVSGLNPHARLVEVRKTPERDEVVVLDVDVEVSQMRLFDIRPTERLAVFFQEQGSSNPEVLALRKDFPHVPHVNPRNEEIPRSLCLYEESVDEIRRTWTAARFVERVRWWLGETARGTLHGQDQPLEPVLLGGFPPLVLPANFLESISSTNPQPLNIEPRLAGSSYVYVARRGGFDGGFAAIGFVAEPHVHGAIRLQPDNLSRLNEILKEVGLDIVKGLRDRLAGWERCVLNLPAILIVALPKRRKAGGAVEVHEYWAFLLEKTVGEVGAAVGIFQRYGADYGRILNGQPDDRLIRETKLFVLNPTLSLSRTRAAAQNGTQPVRLKIAAIGLAGCGKIDLGGCFPLLSA